MVAPSWRLHATVAALLAASVTAFSCSTFGVRRDSRLSMATWSDSRAVREYQDFLSSGKSEMDVAEDGPSVIVTPEDKTPLAEALVALGEGKDLLVTPGEELPNTLGDRESYPIYITVPPTELKDVLSSLSDSWKPRREDMVFFSGGLQYGCIEQLLKDYGLCRDSMTQVLAIGFTLGPRPEDTSVQLGLDAQGEDKRTGECSACGKWNGAIAERLERNGIRCRTGFYREWRRHMWERTAYDAVFNLVGAVRSEPTTLADVALYYEQEVSEMMWQISGLLRGSRAITLTYGFEERIFGMAEADDQPCTLVEEMYPFLYEPFETAALLMEYVHYAQDEMGLIPNLKLPPSRGKLDKSPIIRQGNLRADGVL